MAKGNNQSAGGSGPAALIQCSDTVKYVQIAGYWVRVSHRDGLPPLAEKVNESDVPDNCKTAMA
jgi:hypothetical protein